MADNIYDPKYPGNQVFTPGSDSAGAIPASDISRVLPRQLSTGSTRGTQTVGYGNTKIDGTNNTITIENPTTDVTISLGVIQGSITGSGVGLSISNANNFNLFKMDGQTWYWYSPTTGKNVMQVGLLPDGSYGWAVAAPGYNVSDGFS